MLLLDLQVMLFALWKEEEFMDGEIIQMDSLDSQIIKK
jgi:hypothetical protein